MAKKNLLLQNKHIGRHTQTCYLKELTHFPFFPFILVLIFVEKKERKTDQMKGDLLLSAKRACQHACFFLKFCREACSFGTLVLIDFIVLSAQHSYLSFEILPGNTFIRPTLSFGTQE